MQLEKLKSPGLIFLSFILFLLTTGANAQHGYIPGFIIKQSGDTVHGLIKQQNSKKSTLRCWFKTNKSSESRSFEPSDLQGYRFSNSKYYITKEYKTDKRGESVFMEYLIKGKANIYYFRNASGDHYMIEKESEEMIELTEPQNYIQKEGYGTVKVEPKYKGKLLFELKDCNSIQSAILNSKLNNTSLTQLGKQYHDCVCTTESCVIYEKEKLKPVIRYSLVGGYTVTRYNFGNELATNFGSGFQTGVIVNFRNILFSDAKLGFTAGLLFERDFSFTLSKFDKENKDAINVSYKGEQYAIDNEESLLTVSQLDVNLNVKALKIPVMFNYSLVRKNFLLEAGIGVSNKFILSSNPEFEYDTFNREYGQSLTGYFLGPAASFSSGIVFPNHRTLTLTITGEYLTDPKINQFLILKITQFTFRVAYTL